MNKIFCLFFLFFMPLFAERGIVVACADRHAEFLIPSLAYLRWDIGSTLPIEVWYAGDELSQKNIETLSHFAPIKFRDIVEVLGAPASQYRGWQIKPLMMEATEFDELILMDADVYFYEDPEILFHHKKYQESGAFFFRDQDDWIIPTKLEKIQKKCPYPLTIEKYRERKTFIQELIQTPGESLPADWKHYWSEIEPTDEKPVASEQQESGCLAFNKRMHEKGLSGIVKLNRDHKRTYSYIYGDKETYWIGLEMANEPYSFNDAIPYKLYGSFEYSVTRRRVSLVHFVDGKMFFQQKHPIKLGNWPRFIRNVDRGLTEEEKEKMQRAFFYKEMFTSRRKLGGDKPSPFLRWK